MKLNKKKRPYIEPDPAKPCRVVDKNGLIYHPTKAPDGLCKCGVMLGLMPKSEDYVFDSRQRAAHAKDHTIKFLFQSNLPVDKSNFIIESVGEK